MGNMKVTRCVGAALITFGLTCAAMAAWTSPDGTVHTNSSTCNSETKGRYCRLCCLNFHPDNTSAAYTTCIGGCPASQEVPPGEA